MKLLLFLIDSITCVLSYILSLILRTNFDFFVFRHPIPYSQIKVNVVSIVIILIAQTISFYFFGLYELINKKQYLFNFKDSIIASIVSIAIIITISFFVSETYYYQRSVITVYAGIQTLTIILIRKIISTISITNGKRKNVVFIGITDITKNLIDEIEANTILNKHYNIMGVLSQNSNNHNEHIENDKFCGYPILGSKEDLKDIIKKHHIDEILIVSEENWQDKVLNDLFEVENGRKMALCNVHIIPSPYEIKIGKLRFSKIHDIPMFNVNNQLRNAPQSLIKRGFDVFFSVLFLLLTSPISIISAILIKLTSKGPIFYYQRRVGKDMKRFTIIKFRTMLNNAERISGITLSPKYDERVTSIGKFLRATRIDELPQLINIIKGDMSFVGPRPERQFFVRKFIKNIDSYAERFKVKPGLTGFAQIQGDYHTKAEVKLKYDLSYIYNWSIWLEIRILLETAKVILTRKGH